MISTERFTWVAGTRTFVAEVSELQDLEMIRVYPDSCDVGFDLVSHKTGKVVRMVQSEEKCDKDGNGWFEFIPAFAKDRKQYDFKVLVFND